MKIRVSNPNWRTFSFVPIGVLETVLYGCCGCRTRRFPRLRPGRWNRLSTKNSFHDLASAPPTNKSSRSLYFTCASVDSAISSARLRTRTFSSSDRDLTASSICVMQNGHPTASVSGFASLIWSKRFWLIRVPSLSSFQKHPPPAPQQNVRCFARRRSLQDSTSRLRVTSSTISITSRVWTFSSSCLALMPSPSIVIQ